LDLFFPLQLFGMLT